MVERQLAARGIRDPLVLEAFLAVPREDFVPEDLVEDAYRDSPLPIGSGQTISQPYIVALTVEALQLKGGERVLEIGTGSGYEAAILARIASEVFSVERVPELARVATARLARLGYDQVHVLRGDGTLGWKEHAPFDAIAVSAGGPRVPEALIAHLRATRTSQSEHEETHLCGVRFVPLIGAQGWDGGEDGRGSPTGTSEPDHGPLVRRRRGA